MGFTPFVISTSGLALQTTTGVAGFALQNGTPTIITWTPPNDGNMHRVILLGELIVSSAETGGQVNLSFTDPGGGARSSQVQAAAAAAGAHYFAAPNLVTVQGGSPVTLAQQTALTAGASILYAEIWGV